MIVGEIGFEGNVKLGHKITFYGRLAGRIFGNGTLKHQ